MTVHVMDASGTPVENFVLRVFARDCYEIDESCAAAARAGIPTASPTPTAFRRVSSS
ncbi:MAG: hypothetical protein IPM13_18200 [Phycisphaerales bacterium]|nr:hypothetical protein [Phycisphaerales bacterium]